MESLSIMDSPGSCDSVISTNSGYVSAADWVPLTLLLICSLYNATCRHTLQIRYFAQAFQNEQKFWQRSVVGNKRSEICASCCSNVCMHIYSQKRGPDEIRRGTESVWGEMHSETVLFWKVSLRDFSSRMIRRAKISSYSQAPALNSSEMSIENKRWLRMKKDIRCGIISHSFAAVWTQNNFDPCIMPCLEDRGCFRVEIDEMSGICFTVSYFVCRVKTVCSTYLQRREHVSCIWRKQLKHWRSRRTAAYPTMNQIRDYRQEKEVEWE